MIPVANAHDFEALLPPAVRAAIDSASHLREMPKGTRIMREGDQANTVYQVLSGSAKVSSTSHDGRETVLAVIVQHGWVALSEVFSGLPATADVTALTRVRLRAIPKAGMLTLMRHHPVIATEMLRVLSLRFSLMCHFMVDRTVLTLKERVVKTLYMLAHLQSSTTGAVTIALSQEELGRLLGTGRQALNRVLKVMERERLLFVGYGGIEISDVAELQFRYGYLLDVNEPMAVSSN